jgi:hypothetical protein
MIMARGVWLLLLAAFGSQGQEPDIDFSKYSRECGVAMERKGSALEISWPMEASEVGQLQLNLRNGEPLIAMLGVSGTPVLTNLEPVFFMTVGTRLAPSGRPPEMSKWNVFFDKPAKRPHQTFASALELKRVSVSSEGRRATIAIGELSIGNFRGELHFTFYAGARLLHVEAVVATEEDDRAFIYDAGLVGENPGWQEIAWKSHDTAKLSQVPVGPHFPSRNLATKHRMIIAQSPKGALACFPPPHQFQFPRDWTDNLKFNWFGQNYGSNALPYGLGIRQVADGGRPFEPWFNAPPGTRQRLGVFYLLTGSNANHAYNETLRYTRGDRFAKVPGHITFTSHYHMAVAIEAMKRNFTGTPEFVDVFKEMGVDAVHIADFHGDGHQNDPGPLRLPEMEAMFKECRRLSDKRFLLIPGEEISDFLGLRGPGRHPGHWMSLFPKPVTWIQKRAADQPFATNDARFGKVYRVGSREDMVRLVAAEDGLAWVAHPRIKASSWTPDIFRKEDFYLADSWLGAAWKAMPADLSRERLGERCLALLDDMCNWGQRKYLPGEVDVFKIDRTHELYGHMNINYVRLNRLPRYENGWQPIMDALRRGQFFITTGEILIREFTLNGKESGEALRVRDRPGDLRVALDWTFPLRFAEVISGDGKNVFRERVSLSDTPAFGSRKLKLRPEIRGRKWLRFEVWDMAANGAFTQPIWLE